MAYFGGIFFANMGGGGGQNYFHYDPNAQTPMTPAECKKLRTEKLRAAFRSPPKNFFGVCSVAGMQQLRGLGTCTSALSR